MIVQRWKLPIRYAPGTILRSDSILFLTDSDCIALGRTICICEGLAKQKIVVMFKDRVLEYMEFTYKSKRYLTSLLMYSQNNDETKSISCQKLLFTKAIETLLQDTKMTNWASSIKSAQRYKLENILMKKPLLRNEYIDALYKYDKVAYLDETIENLLLVNNEYPLLPCALDLITMKSNIQADSVDVNIEDITNTIVEDTVYDITVPVKSYLSLAKPMEKAIIGELSEHSACPKLIINIDAKGPDVSKFYDYAVPISKKALRGDIELDQVYAVIDAMDRCSATYFSIVYDLLTHKADVKYIGNLYFKASGFAKDITDISTALEYVGTIFNSECSKISVCKTVLNEIFIQIDFKDGHTGSLYIDLGIFDLLAQDLISL